LRTWTSTQACRPAPGDSPLTRNSGVMPALVDTSGRRSSEPSNPTAPAAWASSITAVMATSATAAAGHGLPVATGSGVRARRRMTSTPNWSASAGSS